MNCKEVKDIAFEFSIRHNNTTLTNEFENHLANCEDCNSYHEFHRSLFINIKQEIEETQVNPFISTQILNKNGLRRSSLYRFKWYLQPVLTFIILAFAIGTGIMLGKKNSFIYSNSSVKSTEQNNEYSEYVTYINNEQFEQYYINLIDYE